MTPPFNLDMLTVPTGLTGKLGIEITEMSAEQVIGTMPVAGNEQPFGLLHGGASAALAETLGSIHAAVLAPAGRIPVGVELNCTHHRSARSGQVTAVCVPAHVGQTMASFEIIVRNDQGQRICTSRLTCAYIEVRD